METELFIRCREADIELVEESSKSAAAEFEKQVGFSVETEIERDHPLEAGRF